MSSGIANIIVEGAQNKVCNKLDSLFFKKMGGISKLQIENAIKKIGDDDLKDNFVGVFPSNYMNKFIDHASMISSKGKYPFIIGNTDNSEKPGVHYWSILNIEPKKRYFFL